MFGGVRSSRGGFELTRPCARPSCAVCTTSQAKFADTVDGSVLCPSPAPIELGSDTGDPAAGRCHAAACATSRYQRAGLGSPMLDQALAIQRDSRQIRRACWARPLVKLQSACRDDLDHSSDAPAVRRQLDPGQPPPRPGSEAYQAQSSRTCAAHFTVDLTLPRPRRSSPAQNGQADRMPPPRQAGLPAGSKEPA